MHYQSTECFIQDISPITKEPIDTDANNINSILDLFINTLKDVVTEAYFPMTFLVYDKFGNMVISCERTENNDIIFNFDQESLNCNSSFYSTHFGLNNIICTNYICKLLDYAKNKYNIDIYNIEGLETALGYYLSSLIEYIDSIDLGSWLFTTTLDSINDKFHHSIISKKDS